MQEQPIQLEATISANLSREDRAYIEKIDARILELLGGQHVRDVKNTKTLELIWELVKARGEFLRTIPGERDIVREGEFLSFKRQYDRQAAQLVNLGIATIENDETQPAIESVPVLCHGERFPLPTWEQVRARLEAQKEVVDFKKSQGFGRLLLVPIGMSLDTLAKHVGDLLVQKSKEGILRYRGGSRISSELLNAEEPIFIDPMLQYSDEESFGRYYPESFSGDEGMTKFEYLEQQRTSKSSATPGWEILLVESDLELPRSNADSKDIRGGRARFTVGEYTPEYLRKLHTQEEYAHEAGMTIESWLCLMADGVAETGEVIDIDEVLGYEVLLLGNYFSNLPEGPTTVRASWSVRYKSATIHPSRANPYSYGSGVRTVVRF